MRWMAVTWTMCFCWGAATTNLFAADVWHFLDAWHFHRLDGMELCLGEPQWHADKTYVDPVRVQVNDHLTAAGHFLRRL